MSLTPKKPTPSSTMTIDEVTDSDRKEKSGSNKRKYQEITTKEMVDFLSKRRENWEEMNHSSGELVVKTEAYAPRFPNVVLVCFTTIDERKGVSRKKGADAIRLVAWDKENGGPVTGKKKTLRIKTWRKNLASKMDAMMEDRGDSIRECDECGSFMIKREGKFGDFWGCSSYPVCENTVNID